MPDESFICPECSKLHDRPRMIYKGLACCKDCYSTFQALNRILMGAQF